MPSSHGEIGFIQSLDVKSHLTQLLSRNLPHPQVQKLAVEERKKNFVDKGETHQDT